MHLGYMEAYAYKELNLVADMLKEQVWNAEPLKPNSR